MRRAGPLWLGAGLAGLVALLLAVAAHRRDSTRIPPAGPKTWASPRDGATDQAPGPNPPSAPDRSRPAPAPASDLSRFPAFVSAIEARALSDVESWRDRHGALAALGKIREAILRPAADRAEGLRQAFLARLIPFVAAADPTSAPAALALCRDVLQTPGTEGWTRFQVIAGLGGMASTRMSAVQPPEGPLVHAFHADAEPQNLNGPYQASMLELLRKDPTSAEILIGVMASDADFNVRAVAVRAVAESGAPGAEAAVERVFRSDEDPYVRAAGLAGLARLECPTLSEMFSHALLTDDSTDMHEAALRLLPSALAYDGKVAALLSGCLSAGQPADALSSLSEAAFAYLAKGQGHELQPALVSLLVRPESLPQVADVFARQAVSLQMTQFVPVFQAVAATAPEGSEAKAALERGVRQLSEAPRYAALAEQSRDLSAAIRALWQDVNRPGLDEERRQEGVARIGRLTLDLWKLQGELRK